jgi:hypothetical protein
MKFSVVLTIQSPMDLVLVSKLRTVGNFPIGIQKVLPFGNANKNGIDYAHTSFDKSVLASFCPNRGKIAYSCGQGFSLCDVLVSSSVFGKNKKGWFYSTLEGLTKSRFSWIMASCKFSDLLRKYKIPVSKLLPKHSSPCTLCEMVFLSRDTGKLKGCIDYESNL